MGVMNFERVNYSLLHVICNHTVLWLSSSMEDLHGSNFQQVNLCSNDGLTLDCSNTIHNSQFHVINNNKYYYLQEM